LKRRVAGRLERALPAAGLLLVLAIAGWRLGDASYADDVTTICDAEGRSGLTLRRDMPALTEWVRARLGTPRGSALFASLRDLPFAERGAQLRAAARVTETRCRVADAYDALAEEAVFRGDVEHLCSRVETPVADLDEGERLQLLEEWIATRAASERTAAIGGWLRAATGPEDRAGVLAAAAHGAGLLSCDVARDLAKPR